AEVTFHRLRSPRCNAWLFSCKATLGQKSTRATTGDVRILGAGEGGGLDQRARCNFSLSRQGSSRGRLRFGERSRPDSRDRSQGRRISDATGLRRLGTRSGG